MSEVKRYHEFKNGIVENEHGMFVKHDDYAALQQKLDAVTADNFGLSSAAYTLLQMLETSEGFPDAVARMEKALEIPATDAQVNALRAEGVEMYAKACESFGLCTSSHTVNYIKAFAAQLRNGEHAAKESDNG